MRLYVMVLMIVLASVVSVTASQDEWVMRVHQGSRTDRFILSGVDSLTFYSYNDTTSPPMVLVPAGVFTMGDGVAYCGENEHVVFLTRSFYLGQHEVTNQEYLEAVQWAYDHGYVDASSSVVTDNLDVSSDALLTLQPGDDDCEIGFQDGVFYLRDAGHGINPDHPVKYVSWFGCARYCDWLSLQAGLPRAYRHDGRWLCNGGDPYGAEGYRLPTDAEWEYAAQYDDERIYPWGDNAPDCSWANYWSSSACVGWTAPVGSYPDAPAALGLSDMSGNVREYCNDGHVCNLGTEPVIDPVGAGGPYDYTNVTRGGSWKQPAELLMCAHRRDDYANQGSSSTGFRIARTVNP